MKKLLIPSALLVLCAGALAGSLSVTVTDKEGKPVPDAVVLVFPSDKSVLSKTPLPAQATITQEKMQFLPHVTLVPVGAPGRAPGLHQPVIFGFSVMNLATIPFMKGPSPPVKPFQ